MANPYAVLGIRPTATPEEVRSAFRKMAMRYHPDRAGDDPKAAARMAEVNAAYDRLRLSEKDEDGPDNPTTYMRLLNDRERDVLEKRVQKLQKKAGRTRKLSRLRSPFGKVDAEPHFLPLSAIRMEDDGLRLIFEGAPRSIDDLLLFPKLRFAGNGVIQVNSDALKEVVAPECPARTSAVYVKDSADFIDDFDGILHLQFDT